MKFLKELTYDNYAFWLGDGVNERLNISTKAQLAEKIYSQLEDETKEKYNLDTENLNLTEVSQVFLDSATGSSHNLLTLLTNDLKYFGEAKPYSYLAKIANINTVITHDHSKILEHIWEDGESHNIFKEKEINPATVNLFKILGDYSHIEQLVLTSQNLRKVKKLKLYNHFWEKLTDQVNEKNLILMGITLDQDSKDVLEFVLSKFKNNEMKKYFVTTKQLSQEEILWLNLQGFEFINEEDETFISNLYLHYTGLTFEDDPAPTDTIKDLGDIIDTENIKDFTGLLDIDELIAQNEENKSEELAELEVLNNNNNNSDTITEIIETELKEEFEEPNDFDENIDIDNLENDLDSLEELKTVDGVEDSQIEVEAINQENEVDEEINEITVEEVVLESDEIQTMDTNLEQEEIIIEETIINKEELTLEESIDSVEDEITIKTKEIKEELSSEDEDLKLIQESMAILKNTPGFDLKENLGIEIEKEEEQDNNNNNNIDEIVIEDLKKTEIIEENITEEIIEKQPEVNIEEKVETEVIEENIHSKNKSENENIENEVEIENEIVAETPTEYKVKNLEIPLFVSVNTIHAEINDRETQFRGRRISEFREARYPSYKIVDLSNLESYKALGIQIPFQSNPLPKVELGKKEFVGKVDIKCGDQTIYGVGLKSHVLEKQNIVEFKTRDFNLTLLLKNGSVTNFSYKIAENTVNIKGKNLYLFFKNLFSGLELSFENKKKASGAFKIISAKDDLEQVNIIVNTLNLYFDIKDKIKVKNIKLKDLLKNTNSLKVLHSFYTARPKLIRGNITLRSIFSDDSILDCRKLHTSYPIDINFLGKTYSYTEFSTISITSDNINKNNEYVEIQAFDVEEQITYKLRENY